jgi:peptidoglycan/LPS O-acetylase OafA/YrhL
VFLHLNLFNPFPSAFVSGVLHMTEMSVGVDLFFVISGFVISMALAPLWNVRTSQDAFGFRDLPLRFYQKRFIRLWPAATLWLVLNLGLAALFRGHSGWPGTGDAFVKLVSGIVYLYNFQEYTRNSSLGYFWSLSVEWQFYLLFPILLLFVRNDILRLAIPFAALCLMVWFQPGGPLWWLFRFDGIPFGILVYVLFFRMGITIPAYRSLERRVFRHVLTATLIVAIAFTPRFGFSGRFGAVIASAFCCVPVALAATNRGYITALGLGPVVSWLGSRSYSIYVAHIPVAMSVVSLFEIARSKYPALQHPHNAGYAYYIICVAMIALVSELTYRFVEMPSHRASQSIALFSRGPASGTVPVSYTATANSLTHLEAKG